MAGLRSTGRVRERSIAACTLPRALVCIFERANTARDAGVHATERFDSLRNCVIFVDSLRHSELITQARVVSLEFALKLVTCIRNTPHF